MEWVQVSKGVFYHQLLPTHAMMINDSLYITRCSGFSEKPSLCEESLKQCSWALHSL